jgi:tetratricopeptide (TPR) repeat protein
MPEADRRHLPVPRPVALTNVIGAHLEKVLSSSVFKTADSLRELLRFTVDETIAGRGDHLKEYVLGATVLGKGDSFDPKADPIVRVQMRRLRKRLDRYYTTEGRYDSLLIEIPKGTYIPTFRPTAHDDGFAVSAASEETLVVGREKELTELRAAFESAAGGKGRLFCLAGEAGIGKTTVVERFLRELATSGVGCWVARGRCSERLAGSEAYLPVLDALETLLRGGGDAVARLMSAVAPTWYVQIAPQTGHPLEDRILTESRVASQVRLKRELVTLFEELARLHPLVIFLDDLHWADAATVDMLAYAGTRCCSQRILIVGTYRRSDLLAIEHPFLRVKLELQGHDICREIAMPFLTRADVKRYLALQFPDHHFPPELSARIHDRTEGNPLFMADLVRFLRDRGVFAQTEGHWVVVGQFPEVEHDLPESVRSMVEKKLSELSDADRRLMSAAAVQGQEFDSAVVARALEMDPTDAEERLEGLDRTCGLIRLIGDRELPDSTLTLRYRFVHVLYQNALQSALTATRTASLSIAVAQALVELYQDQAGDLAADLALLFETGRDFARASDFFLEAAQNAGRVYAAQEAIALARRAIVNAEKLKGRERSSRVMKAALHSASQYESLIRPDEAIADFDVAEGAAAALGQLDVQLHAIFRKGSTLVLTRRLSEVREQGARALRLAEAASSPHGIASSHVILAMERFAAGDVAVAAQLLDRAIPVLRQNDSFNHALWAVLVRGVIDTYQLEHDRADLALRWAYERAGDLRVSFYALMALVHRARTLGNRGQLSDAWSMLAEAWRLAELVGDGFWLSSTANARGWLLSELLDTETALRVNTEALQMAREFGVGEGVRISHINVARDFLALGEPEQAWEHLQQADARHPQDIWFHWVYSPRVQAEMASCWIARGDLQRALSCARVSLEQGEQTLSRKRMAWAHKLLGDIAVLEDRPQQGRREFETALSILEHHTCPTIEWRIFGAAAGAAGALGDNVARGELLGRGRAVIQALADSVRDDALRQTFLGAKPIREVLS